MTTAEASKQGNMASTTGADGSEDVNDFLARIRELGDKRDREDDERTRKLEEEIMKGRQERAARRAERARSISPTKDSPASVISSSAASQSMLATPTPKTEMPPPQQTPTTSSSPLAQEPSKPTPPPQSGLSRSGTLSWQQRPGSRGTTPTIRTRPLSMMAAENSRVRSPSATPEPSAAQEKETNEEEQGAMTPPSNRPGSTQKTSPNQAAASMLANKDPNWFKQTADRGMGSAAYRKSEEPGDSDGPARTGSIRLHGLSRESTAEPEKPFGSLRGRPHSMASPSPSLDAKRLESAHSPDLGLERTPTMSPAQGRLSPERLNRPASPTKGMGGFVQSAMLKRNDSVNKRWSAQAPGGLSRGDSVASNRGSRDLGQTAFASPSVGQLADDDLEAETTVQSDPVRDKDGFVKPALPETSEESSKPTLSEISTSRPSSPTKDMKRWSPVKASWLENTINKPDSPKPTISATRQQPAWMADLKMKKNQAGRGSVDLAKGGVPSTPTKTYAVESKPGLLGKVNTMPSSVSAPSLGRPQSIEVSKAPATVVSKEANELSSPEKDTDLASRQDHAEHEQSATPEPMPAIRSNITPKPAVTKLKPETPPKKDLRSNLKSRPVASDKSGSGEPEFKKAFGNLKRAETKNYRAPDTLKENIMRGKTGLNTTGGPQQTKRVDEFKESILAKKKEFQGTPSTPLARNPSQTNEKPVPEALAKRTGMFSRTKSISEVNSGASVVTSPTPELKPSISLPEKTLDTPSAPPAGLKNSALAARFNPNLAGILARGPSPVNPGSQPPGQTQGSRSGGSSDTTENKGPELTHQTKGRARGPKRKPPRAILSETKDSTDPQLSSSTNTPVAQDNLPTESLQEKMNSYNQIKAGLVGDVGKVNALGIVNGSKENSGASTSSVISDASRPVQESLVVEKSKPPAPRSPSTRVASSNFSPKPSQKPAETATSEPLSAIADTSNKVNSSNIPSTPARKVVSVDGNEATSTLESPAKGKSTPTPGVKRMSTFAKAETPARPTSSNYHNSPLASPAPLAKQSRSPQVPAKSPAARNFSSSIGSRQEQTTGSDATSPARQTIQEFFGNLPPPNKSRADIDTQSVINTIGRSSGKIKTLRKQIWELTSDGRRLPMPASGEHILFENCMYVCTHVYGSATGKHTTEAYLWVGDGVSPSAAEDAQLFARNAAKESGAGGRPVLIHQGKETSNFFDALGGILIVRRGSSTDATITFMLCGRKHLGHIAFDEVEFNASSLCSGFPFIISSPDGQLILWKGRGAGADDLGFSRLIAMDLRPASNVEEVDEGSEPDDFWSAIGSTDRPSSSMASHWHLKAAKDNFATRLFAIDDARPRSAGLAAIQAVWNRRPSAPSSDDPSTSDIREVSPYSQNDLAQDGIFVLDAYFEVYVILGWRSSARFPAFRSALIFAQEYAILAASQEDRPFVPAAHVIFAGSSAPYLKSSFRKWDEKRVTTQPVGSTGEAETLPIHEALAAVTA